MDNHRDFWMRVFKSVAVFVIGVLVSAYYAKFLVGDSRGEYTAIILLISGAVLYTGSVLVFFIEKNKK